MDDILFIRHKPEETMKGIKSKFKLKDDKVEEPTYYLGATVSKIKMRMMSNVGQWTRINTVSQQ